MDHIYEMNKQRFDDQVISTYIQSDRIERGKKVDVAAALKFVEDEETAKSKKMMQLGQQQT